MSPGVRAPGVELDTPRGRARSPPFDSRVPTSAGRRGVALVNGNFRAVRQCSTATSAQLWRPGDSKFFTEPSTLVYVLTHILIPSAQASAYLTRGERRRVGPHFEFDR